MKDKGACMVQDAMNLFKDKILDQYGCTVSDNDCEKLSENLRKTIIYQPGDTSHTFQQDSVVVCTMTIFREGT